MPTYRTPVRAIVAGLALGGLVLAGCTDDTADDPMPTMPATSPLTTAPDTDTTTSPGEQPEITPAAAQQLCDMIGSEVDTWRDQGTAVARVSFNGTVQNWAARNDGLNDEILRDKTIVDDVTTQACPDVRQNALDALGTEDLAGALVGMGG
ncbi:hypothetical protein IU433_03170 [Nocardia puris]|uniref:Uncharacterized protein n=1 Tax=Nocardia puris TaxID=208602 RepID=A0A366DVT9_9NOCA|nr:hypothetical protein [Nocardia puris]MBF6210046.1 hypothetical protein [Nocardia puris]MBF6368237.1 hypothetical protein [Nocardia puris]MBF6458044.1 hypothetical protein [Nocardia puris]RBO94206.1 hypothetical protein DFR74_102629 [Nocardia puris]